MRLNWETRASLVLLVCLAMVPGCCTFKSCPTKDTIEITASRALNSCDNTGQHPVTVRIYSLAATTAFRNTDFDALWDDDMAALGADRVGVKEQILLPGQTITLELTRDARTTAFGIVGNFCQLQPNCWRRTIALGDGGAKIRLSVEGTCISIE